MGVPPSSSGGFHDSFTCSARTFSFILIQSTILKCPENHLIRLEQPWLAWYVEHVDKASCFKAESEGSFEDYVERNIVLVEYSLNDSVPNMNGG